MRTSNRWRGVARDGARREVLRELERQGWRVELTRGGHVRAVPPDVALPMVVTGGTPSDHRALAAWVTQLRRSGFRWPAVGAG